MNISNNVSSMLAHQNMLNTTANNVANVNTDGFVPNSTRITNKDNSVVANSVKANDNGSKKSQTDLAKEIPDSMISSRAVEANVNVVKTQDDMLGSLLDIKA